MADDWRSGTHGKGITVEKIMKDDPLGIVKGLFNGCFFAAILWAIIIAVIIWVF
jgi:hypothetical protein